MSAAVIPDEALKSHTAILGKTGSGKSNAGKVVMETLLSRRERACVVDPTGTWWGLRSKPDGSPSRFKPVIFGGEHADVPIGAGHGAAIAETIGTTSTPAIVDTRLLKVSERTRFFTDFAETLLRTNKGPLTLFIDEAHLFAPQGRVNDPRSGEMLHAANNLVSLGRGIGLSIVLISQRPAKLHKDSLTQVETLVAMRLIHNLDVDAVKAWIGECADPAEGRELVASLPALPVGDAWVWSPALGILKRAHFPLATTFDSGRALAADAAVALAPIDLKGVAKRLEQVGKEVLANDPARLRARIAELERQARDAAAAAAKAGQVPDPEVLAGAERRGWELGTRQVQEAVAAAHREAVDAMFKVLGDGYADLVARLEELRGTGEARVPELAPSAPAPDKRTAPKPVPRQVETVKPRQPEPPPATPDAAGGALTPAKQRILIALRQLEAIGQGEPEKDSVAWFAGASPKSSTFTNNLGALRSAGLIDYPGAGRVALTGEGAALVPPVPAPTQADVLALVASKVPPAQMRIVEAAVRAFPGEIGKAELAEAVGASATSSTYTNNLGRLRSLGLITYPCQGVVRAAEVLFP